MNSHSKLIRHVFPEGPPFEKIVAAYTVRHSQDDPSRGDMNTGLHVGDDPITVVQNRRRIFAELDMDPDLFTAAQQVHGENIHRVTEADRGRGAVSYEDAIPATDALVTDLPGVPIGVFTADCVPILRYDPRRLVVGAVHAGWRSTVAGIGAKAMQKMTVEFGSNPEDMWAAFGPSIGPCCYEVGRDVVERFGADPEDVSRISSGSESREPLSSRALFRKTGDEKWHLDLWLANRRQLEESGVRSDHIIEAGVCSFCNSYEVFSARRLGVRAGRTLSLIAIKANNG